MEALVLLLPTRTTLRPIPSLFFCASTQLNTRKANLVALHVRRNTFGDLNRPKYGFQEVDIFLIPKLSKQTFNQRQVNGGLAIGKDAARLM
jgi:hypothetical protein